MATTPDPARTFKVRVDYYSDEECFASETFTIEMPLGGDPNVAARSAAEASSYYDLRVPDLSYQITICAVDPEDPEDPPPANAAVKPICSGCGADSLVRDASVRWGQDSQSWEISGIFDCATCDACGAESDTLATWAPVTHVAAPQRFANELAASVGVPDLAADGNFLQFCLEHFLAHTIDEAAAIWAARRARA